MERRPSYPWRLCIKPSSVVMLDVVRIEEKVTEDGVDY